MGGSANCGPSTHSLKENRITQAEVETLAGGRGVDLSRSGRAPSLVHPAEQESAINKPRVKQYV
jgi:hypothetical protein